MEYRFKYIGFKNRNANPQISCIIFNNLTILRTIPWIHYQKFQLKIKLIMSLQFLKQLRHQHGVLATGDTYCNLISFLNQLIFVNCLGEFAPDSFTKFLADALLYILTNGGILFFAFLLCSLFHKPCKIATSQTIGLYALLS